VQDPHASPIAWRDRPRRSSRRSRRALAEEKLSALGSDELHERLLSLPGVGPWTAALLMLRGFGRLEQFPPGDVAAERLLRRLGSAASGKALVEALGDVRGMLYYHLFLDRLAREGKGPFTTRP
jgi:DNA-3-methyladenine glycosylase II